MWKRLPRDVRGTSPSRDERTCASTLDVYASGNITRLTATPCGESACNGKRGSGGSGHDKVRPLRLPRCVAWRGLGYGAGITVLMIVTFLATYYAVGWWVVWR
jgi:hypothetical protein